MTREELHTYIDDLTDEQLAPLKSVHLMDGEAAAKMVQESNAKDTAHNETKLAHEAAIQTKDAEHAKALADQQAKHAEALAAEHDKMQKAFDATHDRLKEVFDELTQTKDALKTANSTIARIAGSTEAGRQMILEQEIAAAEKDLEERTDRLRKLKEPQLAQTEN